MPTNEEVQAALNMYETQKQPNPYNFLETLQTMAPSVSVETTTKQKAPVQNVAGPIMQIAAPKTAMNPTTFAELVQRQTEGMKQQRAGLSQFDEQLAKLSAAQPSQATQVFSAISDLMNGGNQFGQVKGMEAAGRKQMMDLQQNVQKYKNDLTDKEVDLLKAQFQNDTAERHAATQESLMRQKLALEAGKQPEIKDFQAQAAGFGRRMEQAEDIFNRLVKKGYDRTSGAQGAASYLPNTLKNEDLIEQEQAERNFLNATLRKESGASISKDEFASGEKQYFPRAGDTPQVLANKESNRKQAVEMMKLGAGHAWNLIPKVQTKEVSGSGVKAPKVGDVVDGHQYLGGDPAKRESWSS